MALVHEFAILDNSKEYFISSKTEKVEVPDELLKYINDSLEWIYSTWNGDKYNKGLSYYGFSIIEVNEVEKLIKIIRAWKELFECAPCDFLLHGDYLLDEENYEKNKFKKDEVIDLFDSLMILCQKAKKQNFKIIHNGI